jgi:hypothetical protein
MSQPRKSSAERRRHARHALSVPAQLGLATGKTTVGVTRDLSRSGALVMTSGRVALGAPVQVLLYVCEPLEKNPWITGRVCRLEMLDGDQAFRLAAAVEFDDELPVDPPEWCEHLAHA